MIDFNKHYTHVLVIGNGFDLNLGLKTSYFDFLKSPQFESLIYIKKNQLSVYLKEAHDAKLWIDVENELKQFSKQRTEDFEAEYEDLCLALMEYLKGLDYNDINKESKAYQLIKDIRFKDFLILDFNYTDSIVSILDDFGLGHFANEKIIKVHGSVGTEKIVFGIEDDIQIYPNHIFLKKTCNLNYTPIPFNRLLDKANQVIFFGHSLGETDHMYFEKYFQNIAINITIRKNITLWHYGKIGHKELHIQLDKLTLRRVGFLKQNSNFIQMDASKT